MPDFLDSPRLGQWGSATKFDSPRLGQWSYARYDSPRLGQWSYSATGDSPRLGQWSAVNPTFALLFPTREA